MLFMVIEQFRNHDPNPIGERFAHSGRLLPEGVAYHGSWVDASRARCFQVMEAASSADLQVWMDRWSDLIDFEIIQVMSSTEYWAAARLPLDES